MSNDMLRPVEIQVFQAPGEMADRCRALDWSATPLGPVDGWSRSLVTLADMVLASRNPMLLFWGPDLVQIYNDAFRPSLGSASGPGARHPRALGMRAADFWTDVWEVVGPQINGVMTRGEAVWFENLYLPIERDGHMDDAWWTYNYSPVRDDDGRINGTLVVCIEQTASVKAAHALLAERERAEGILAAIADAHVALDTSFRFTAVNPAMERAVGLTKEKILGRSVFDLFPGTKGTEWETHYRAVMTNRTEAHFTLPYHDERLDIVVDADMYPTPDGNMVAFWRDVTHRERSASERERLLDAAEDARRSAELANRAKGDFLAVMSHELRTPLNAISGYAELLEMGVHGPVTDAQRTALDRIQRSQRHLLGLINGVLNYAKLDAGAVHYDATDFPMGAVLGTCEMLIAPQVRERQLRFRNLTPACGAHAHADQEKVQQIVINLLTNAVKFTEPGGEIAIACELSGEGRVLVRVSDTGRGIPPESLESIFQPFVQLDSKLTRASEGVGLGLAISRDLARGMGGDLTVSSQLGEGSTFTLDLPAA